MAAKSWRLSPAMVISTFALIVSLGGGAYALTGIGTKQAPGGAADGSRSASGPGYLTNRSAQISLPGGVNKTIAKLRLPKGDRYILSASAEVGSTSASASLISCEIRDDGKAIAKGIERTDSLAVFSDTVSMNGGSNGGKIRLKCSPDVNALARNRIVTAVKVSRLKTQ